MELSKELYLRKYWKVEEILLLLFEGRESAEFGSQFYADKDFTIYKSELEKEISKAIKSGDLKTHKALDGDNSNYLDRNEFSDWLTLKFKIDINERLYGRSLEFQFDEEPDYLDFSDRVYGGGNFSRHEAFCYLARISITKDKTTWSDNDIKKHLKFDGYENYKERLTYEEILAIAGKENLNVPREILIIIEEAEKFGTQDQPIETSTNKTPEKRLHRLMELINKEDIKLKKELKKKPSTIEVWNRLEEIQEDPTNCIVKIDVDTIHWINRKGEPKIWQLKNLESTLSRIRKRRRNIEK